MDGGVLGGGGEIIDYKIQQVIGTNVAQAGGEEHWKNPVIANGLMQGGNQVLF
jgi:hypothetical protein